MRTEWPADRSTHGVTKGHKTKETKYWLIRNPPSLGFEPWHYIASHITSPYITSHYLTFHNKLCTFHSCHILPFQPILWNKYVPPEPATTAKHSPKSISEGGRIWQVCVLLSYARRARNRDRANTLVHLYHLRRACSSIRRGDDTVGNPHRAQISQFELIERIFFNSSFSSLSSCWT